MTWTQITGLFDLNETYPQNLTQFSDVTRVLLEQILGDTVIYSYHTSMYAFTSCQKATNELNNAKTQDAVEIAVTKVRTLCED